MGDGGGVLDDGHFHTHGLNGTNGRFASRTRTTKANLLWRALVAPYWVNYHVEHHLLMYIPCYRLARFHRLLMAKDYGDRMELQPGYLPVLRLATSRVGS